MQIWKFGLSKHLDVLGIGVHVSMPKGAEILTFQLQDGMPTLWAQVDPDNRREPRSFKIVGTGHDLPEPCIYIGTFQDGPFVWHLIELPPQRVS